ncbi:MAG: hypothetical protein NT129_04425 [Candidatus Aenigmarchaeota archaeon]|nr:hypothetical protein [Candidatus Aenigmarchaeota archaeon]
MPNGISVNFDEKEGVLDVDLNSFYDIIEDGKLTDNFLDTVFRGYKEAEDFERKKQNMKYKPIRRVLKKARGIIGKTMHDYDLPIKEIHLYPREISPIESEYIVNVINKSVGFEAEYNRVMADRWELVEDISVGADVAIDVAAIITGTLKGVSTGNVIEGFAGVGYLTSAGILLLIGYFAIRFKKEEPYKRREKYLTHILTTPITLHRKYGPLDEITFRPNSE